MLGQIVTRNPKSVSPETPIADMIAIMVDNRVDMVPVLTNGDLMGIVTAADIIKLFVRLDAIRQLCAKVEKTEQRRRLVDVLSGGSAKVSAVLSSVLRTVEDIMTGQVVCLASEDNLAKATEVMQKGKFRHVSIVDKQRRLVGIISDRDILRHLPYSSKQRTSQAEVFRAHLFEVDLKDPSLELPLTRIMRRDVAHVLPSCSFYNAVKMLHEMKINCLPVVDDEKKLCGIVTVTDVMRALLAAYALAEKPRANPG